MCARPLHRLTIRPSLHVRLAHLLAGGDQPRHQEAPVLMPASTQRQHFEPAWKGDGPAGISRTAAKARGRDGVKAVDINLQWAWHNPADHSKGGVAYAMHWGRPGRLNNYRFILEPGANRARRMTARERARPISKWPAAAVLRWRRAPQANSARPHTYAELAALAVAEGVTITGELKATAFTTPIAARHVVEAAKAAGHPPWFMALWKSMGGCRAKCSSVIGAGGQFAVIFGRYQRYRRAFRVAVKAWSPKPTRVW